MELKKIKDLMKAMGQSGTKVLKIKQKDGFELHLEREGEPVYQVVEAPRPAPEANPMREELEQHRTSASVSRSTKPQAEEGTAVNSPMVGTFYSSPAPGEPSFVKVGDHVESDSILCIVEAMKVMNEIKAGASGTVVEVFVKDGEPVEFGTPLFRIV